MNVDSESAGAYFGETILLSREFDRDALNRLTITASSWANLRGFCEGNAECVVKSIEADQERCLVLVIMDNGTDGVTCTLDLDGNGRTLAENVVTWMKIPLPITLSEVWTRCAGSALNKGRRPVDKTQSMIAPPVKPEMEPIVNKKRMARYLTPTRTGGSLGVTIRRSDGGAIPRRR